MQKLTASRPNLVARARYRTKPTCLLKPLTTANANANRLLHVDNSSHLFVRIPNAIVTLCVYTRVPLSLARTFVVI